jgi:hypothetical protein
MRTLRQNQAAFSVIALTGQALMHSPQAVQRSAITSGSAAPITRGEKRMAASPQASPQLRQTTLLYATQAEPMTALPGTPASCATGLPAENLPRKNSRREITA